MIVVGSMTHPAEIDPEALLKACEVTRTRRSGPGGQHRNKVETAIVIEHKPSGVRAEASERRSQEDNRRVAVFRLRLKLAQAVRCDRSDEVEPPDLWRSRTRGGKVSVNENHDDFPAMLAIALDYITGDNHDVAAAAKRLACSTSQLIKLLQKEPTALAFVNRQRKEAGLRPLR